MERHGIDLWLSPPALGPAPRGLATTGDPIMNLPWTHAGLPVLGIPAGLSSEGLPLGLQVTGRWWADADLLAWGAELERALQP
jgi:Asp-tRNA(Asn)/Glu-tRNA(Gln) amidotransferase A subunit family amidase